MELDIIRAVQSIANPVLTAVVECVTMLGEPVFTVLAFAFIYWCADKKKGGFIAFSIITSLCLNGIVKDIFKAPRPIGEEGVKSFRTHTATGYSFPSGHTQSVSSFTFSVAAAFKKNFLWVLGIALTVAVGFSRIYLGVHYPKDVIAGGILGFLIPCAVNALDKRVKNKHALHFGAFALFFAVMLFLSPSKDSIKAAAMLLGFAIGFLIDEKRFIFVQPVEKRKRYLSFLFGVLMIAALAGAMKLVFPNVLVFTFIRYMLISLFGIGVFPWLSVMITGKILK